MEREELVLLVESVRIGALDRRAGARVERPATLFQEAVVGNVAGQRVLEHERPLGPSVLFMQELAPLELVQGREQRSITVPDTLDEVERELAPEHGCNLDGALVSGVELVDSCGQDVLHCRRD